MHSKLDKLCLCRSDYPIYACHDRLSELLSTPSRASSSLYPRWDAFVAACVSVCLCCAVLSHSPSGIMCCSRSFSLFRSLFTLGFLFTTYAQASGCECAQFVA